MSLGLPGRNFWCFVFFLSLMGCSHENELPKPNHDLYFPPISTSAWETTSPESLGWSPAAVKSLNDFLELNGTRAFIVLKDGKIVMEEYWGRDIQNISDFNRDTNWYWASAGKTLTAMLVGIAQAEGALQINDKTSKYLGNNWTSLTKEKEDLISLHHQLTMTTGLDYEVANLDCISPSCLRYRADAGTQWYYHNAPYTLLHKVVSKAVNMPFNQYTNAKVEEVIGMKGTWISVGENNVYWSNARSAARFGLLLLNKGDWDQKVVLSDKGYMEKLVSSSQNLNPAYGYLTWLNGKSSIIFPGLAASFNVSLSPNAPADLVAAMGKNGQFIEMVPSEGLVVVRMGEAPENALVPIKFHDEMWAKIRALKN